MTRILPLIASPILVVSSVTAAPLVLPVLNRPIVDRQIAPGVGGQTINLNQVFGTEPIDSQLVRFTSNFSASGVPVVLDMALFSNRTPVTRTNFLKYVADGDYVNSFVHRSAPGFVIQGGGFKFKTEADGSNSVVALDVDPPIVNEFGISNTIGTVSMAKVGGNPNSATSQWFVSTGANSKNLDSQNGGFTVFGRITQSTFSNARIFNDEATFPLHGRTDLHPALDSLPLFYTYTGTGTLSLNQFIHFPSVALVPVPSGQAGETTSLAYSVLSNSNPSTLTVNISPSGSLELGVPSGATGSAMIVIRATDSVGNTVDNSFSVSAVKENYSSWRARSFEPSVSTNNAVSGPNADPDGDGLTNLELFVHGLIPGIHSNPVQFQDQITGGNRRPKFTFPFRNDIQGASFVIETSSDLGQTDLWKTVPSSEVSRSPNGAIDQISIESGNSYSAFPAFFRLRFIAN